MNLISQSVNLTLNGTSSIAFNSPVRQTSILDASNIQFLRQVMLSNDGVQVIRGNYSIQFPMTQLFAVAFQANTSMSWAPIIETDVTPTSSIVLPNTISLSTASITIGASDEFTTDLQYQWYISSSRTNGTWALPTSSVYNTFQGTSSVNLSASFISGSTGLSYFYCAVTNPAGTTTSSISMVSQSYS